MTDYMLDSPRATADVVVAEFTTYEQAQALVDKLSDNEFPVEHVRIVGHGVRLVEQVTGRMTRGRAAASGAASGAWLGLFLGLMLGLFAPVGNWFGVLLTGLVIGAVWGALLGFVAHWGTGGRRDFVSEQALVANRYRVEVDAGFETEALRIAALPVQI